MSSTKAIFSFRVSVIGKSSTRLDPLHVLSLADFWVDSPTLQLCLKSVDPIPAAGMPKPNSPLGPWT